MNVLRVRKKLLTARRVLKTQGLTSTCILALEKLQSYKSRKRFDSNGRQVGGKQIFSMADRNDILSADWTLQRDETNSRTQVPTKPYTINWVMSPPGKGSGGHQNIFRFIKFLEESGHKCNIYLYSTYHFPTVAEVKQTLKESYPKTAAHISWLKGNRMAAADALFATGWETAYPVFNYRKPVKKFYFVQDFEPYFYPMGTDYILAENTYRFGFYGITAGGWLSKMLENQYGMSTDHFDFGADTSIYKCTNIKKRKEIFFYARPVTARRGFELGIMTLELFAKRHPDYTINLAGWDISEYDLPFKVNNLGSVKIEDLSAIYNRCSAALVLSLTNMSLLPLELLACGTIPVVNDGENNRLVSNNDFIAYSPATPAALARTLSEVVTRNEQSSHAQKAAKSIQGNNWEISGKKFVSIVEREIARG